jgi:hypothetical protein
MEALGQNVQEERRMNSPADRVMVLMKALPGALPLASK